MDQSAGATAAPGVSCSLEGAVVHQVFGVFGR